MRPPVSEEPKYPNNIRKVIKRHGWKLSQIVEKTGIPKSTLMDYCAGKVAVPQDRLEKLATRLGYPTSYLVPPLPEAYLSQSQDEQANNAQALAKCLTHCQKSPRDENALRELMVLLAKLSRYEEIEHWYARLLKELQQYTTRGPDPSTTALLDEFRAQKSVASEKVRQAAQTREAVLPETVTHWQEVSTLQEREESLPPTPTRLQTSSSTRLLVYSPSQSVSTQGIIMIGEANAQKLNVRNLRGLYLTSSNDIISSLKAYSSLCQGEVTTCRQQVDIYAEIAQRSTMNDEDIIDPSQITRRDLFTLAIVSPSLLTNIRRGWLTAGVIEEFLSEVMASVTTCWYLLQRSDGLPLVELILPQYLSELVQVVKFSSLYRQRAAYLVAQGFLLRGLVAHHRMHFAEHVAHCQQAVTYAHASGDLTLLVASLEHLSSALLINGQFDESLKMYLQAKDYSENVELSGLSRSMVLAGLGPVHAKQGNNQEVVRCLGEAYATFTEPDDETPVFLRATNDRYQIIQEEGRSSLALGNHAKDQGNLDRARKYWKDAAEKFGKIEQLPSAILVPVRIAAEVAIAQALAYAKAGNMEGFLTAFEKGVKMAKKLGSEKRKQEAREALNVALGKWPHEQRITGLWQLLV